MKYMGSKRALLQNGLGTLLRAELETLERRKGARFLDLFAGAGSVATFAALRTRVPVHANDLQAFSAVLCGAVIERVEPVDSVRLWANWLSRTHAWLDRRSWFGEAVRLERLEWETDAVRFVARARKWAKTSDDSLVRAYAGHYFSPLQASFIAGLRATLPERKPDRTVALAALLDAVSYCSASPGHTAQPFAPAAYGKAEVAALWRRDVLVRAFSALRVLAPRHARTKGTTSTRDANRVARRATGKDLVFVDPPYSAVQYSRFYHVLEAISTGQASPALGRGRYPAIADRPWSAYSAKSEAPAAFEELISVLAESGPRVMLTFPASKASNGLSGAGVAEIAAEYFHVKRTEILGRFSTLGGNGALRPARQDSREIVLVMTPRQRANRSSSSPRVQRPSRLSLSS